MLFPFVRPTGRRRMAVAHRGFLSDARGGCRVDRRCRLDSAVLQPLGDHRDPHRQVPFSITARMDKAVQKAINGIPETAWVSIEYPEAIFDEKQQRWISDAEVAETDYTAFT